MRKDGDEDSGGELSLLDEERELERAVLVVEVVLDRRLRKGREGTR